MLGRVISRQQRRYENPQLHSELHFTTARHYPSSSPPFHSVWVYTYVDITLCTCAMRCTSLSPSLPLSLTLSLSL